MSRRVFLHIGAPKSGTSYLQDRFRANRELLAAQGLTFPETSSGNHFGAALDLIERRWGGELEAARGQWDALVMSAARAPGDVLISHEILAAATPEQIARAHRGFADAEWHVIYTARDLGRQLPAEWQEMVKHRSGMRFRGFMKHVQKEEPGASDFWFWRVQSLPDVLARWGAHLRPDQIHLVTVPPAVGPREALWERFCSVVGIDPARDYEDTETTNASLGIAEVSALRQLNLMLREEGVRRETYVAMVRELVVRQAFAQRLSETATVPAKYRPYADEITESWLEWIQGAGIDVVGDLEDLRPRWDAEGFNPDQPDPELVAEAALRALSAVLVELDHKPSSEPVPRSLKRLARRWRR